MSQIVKLLKTPGRIAGGVFAAALFASAYAAVARPGTVNYTEGQVTLNGTQLDRKALGQTEVAPGEILQTQSGKAEMLLFPGAILRLGDNSAARMVSASLTDTRVEVLRGEAMVEVADIQKENRLDIVDNGVPTQIEKKGIYSFNADHPTLAVYDGKAVVQADDRKVDVGKGKEVLLQPGATLKPQKFDRKQTDSLYEWSKLRSGYLAEANMASAQMVVVNNYPGWWGGTGWYWNPWYSTWAFVPGGGFLTSPFGFGFYSPAYWYYNAPAFYAPGRVWVRRPVGTGFHRGVAARPAAPVGGSGVTSMGPRAGARSRGSFSAPRAGGFSRPMAAGGGGVHFGGRGR
jgi:hypothetical protein